MGYVAVKKYDSSRRVLIAIDNILTIFIPPHSLSIPLSVPFSICLIQQYILMVVCMGGMNFAYIIKIYERANGLSATNALE